jgi:fructose-1,6-bisphosphate aldolase class II
MLVNANGMLKEARTNKYAVPQFNINNLEWTRYILETCDEIRTPVILGVSEGAAKYMGGYKTIYNIVIGLIEELSISVPVALHLDHGSNYDNCKKAIDSGFTSVMIDASKYDIEENVRLTNEVVQYGRRKNVSVEAEVGHIGGTEDNITSESSYATVEDCVKLVEETNVDILAPALGSVHGLYKGEPKLDFERMNQIKELTDKPLALHGGTGIDDEKIKKAIECGVSKININTELQIAWATNVREYLEENKEEYDPRKIISSGKKGLIETVREKTRLFGSDNKY